MTYEFKKEEQKRAEMSSQDLKLNAEMILYRIASGKWDIQDVRKRLYRDDFIESSHLELFDTLIAINNRGEVINPDSFILELIERESLEAYGGVESIRDMIAISETIDVEEELSTLKDKSTLRKIFKYSNGQDPRKALEYIKRIIEKNTPSSTSNISLLSMEKRLSTLDEKLALFRGQQYLGLCQRTLDQVDDKFLGLRKLILLAAAPNVGKTAFTVQVALDVLTAHQEACLVYFSLEMQESDIFIRMFCNLAKMNYRAFVLGSDTRNRALDSSAYFTEEESTSIQNARQELAEIGDRLQIVDSVRAPVLDAKKAIELIKQVKEKTGTNRVIVVIDYLQVWPLPQDQKFHNELEIDKWRIGEIKKIRDAINDDPIIVISEARKPSNTSSIWGGEMADVMGSARATYTPDSVLLLSQMSAEDVVKIVKKRASDEDIAKMKNHLEKEGFSICRLDCPKGRDGMERFSLYLKFFYRRNIFQSIKEGAIEYEFRNF